MSLLTHCQEFTQSILQDNYIWEHILVTILNLPSSHLLRAALSRTGTAYRPATRNAHLTHVKTYVAFTIFMELPVEQNVHSILAFLEYLFTNSVSYKVMLNYISSVKKAATKYHQRCVLID